MFGKDQPNGKDYYWIKSYKMVVLYHSNAINVCEDGGGVMELMDYVYSA
ncbi:MAG: hypothetical protein IPG89_02980 [Bacteroidetes bacterium]|nr:hypothetical protein [Bacteroidota bacterium]